MTIAAAPYADAIFRAPEFPSPTKTHFPLKFVNIKNLKPVLGVDFSMSVCVENGYMAV